MVLISPHEFFDLYAAALPICLSILTQDRELKSLELLPSSGPFFLPDACGRPAPLFLRPDFAIGRTTMIDGHWQRRDPEFFAEHVRQSQHGSGIAIVDIGANIGLFTRQLMAMVGECVHSVWCYEPDPTNFEILNRNLAALPCLHAIEAGLSEREHRVPLYEDPRNSGNYSLYAAMMPVPDVGVVDVAILSVREQARLWLEPDLPVYYKSDTQGHDMTIAAAIGGDFWSRVSCAMLELCPVEEPDYDPDGFRSVVEAFPHRAYADSPQLPVTAADVMAFLLDGNNRGVDKDLLLWR